MEEEQVVYLRWLIQIDHSPKDKALFEEFKQDKFTGRTLTHTEIELCDAWKAFKRKRRRPDTTAMDLRQQTEPGYSKLEFPELRPGPVPGHKPIPVKTVSSSHHGPKTNATPTPTQAPFAVAKIEGKAAVDGSSSLVPPAALSPVTGPVTAHAQPEKKMHAPTPPAQPPRPNLRFSINNARQGEVFEEVIKIDPDPAASFVELIEVKFPNGMGLGTDNANWRINGTPALSGDFNFTVQYRYSNDPAGVVRSGMLSLIVNPNPKLLWQDLPSNRNEPFWKEDNAHGLATGSDARIVAARLRGRSHAHKATCCDDDFVIHADPSHGWYLAVVADGAGSAKFSRRGSYLSTTTAAEHLRKTFCTAEGEALAQAMEAYAAAFESGNGCDDNSAIAQTLRNSLYVTVGYAAHAAVKTLIAEASSRSETFRDVKELSTTLLIGLARKVGARWVCAAYWVGDGAIGVYRRNKEVVLLGDPDSGEYSGQTRFLSAQVVTQEELLRRLRFTCVEDLTAMVLMTDGVSDPKFPSETQMGKLEEWDALWDEMDAAVELANADASLEARLLDWLKFWATGEYDDRTIAIIY